MLRGELPMRWERRCAQGIVDDSIGYLARIIRDMIE